MSEPKKPLTRAKQPERGVRAVRQVKDIAILGGPTEDGEGAQLLRVRDGKVTAGEIRPVKEGQSIGQSEVVRLRPLDAEKRVCAVEVLHEPKALPSDADGRPTTPAAPSPPLSRPARVATARYRKNWDAIFDAKRKPGAKWSVN